MSDDKSDFARPSAGDDPAVAADQSAERSSRKTQLILVGGFLGAGKTTWITKCVNYLAASGAKCAVITNDQAPGLLDTGTISTLTEARVEEISGACFCCSLDQLSSRIEALCEAERPDYIFAEPVGSCTDLTATIIMPLRRLYHSPVAISPLTTLIDVRRARASFGNAKDRKKGFAKEIGYIFGKQLEEAEIIMVTKADVTDEDGLRDVTAGLEKRFPGKRILASSARKGVGIGEWLEEVMGNLSEPLALMDVDYQTYGEGEALLGWLNLGAEIRFGRSQDGNQWIMALAKVISSALATHDFEIAHFKMSLDEGTGSRARVHQVMSAAGVECDERLDAPVERGRLMVNLRAEGDPQRFREIVLGALEATPCEYSVQNEAAFRPSQPKPTHRVGVL